MVKFFFLIRHDHEFNLSLVFNHSLLRCSITEHVFCFAFCCSSLAGYAALLHVERVISSEMTKWFRLDDSSFRCHRHSPFSTKANQCQAKRLDGFTIGRDTYIYGEPVFSG